MRARRLLVGPLVLGVTLGGCPRKPVEPPPVEPGVVAPQVGTLALRFDTIDLSLYDDLVAGPAAGTSVAVLSARHDAERYTASLQDWGPGLAPVVQFEDSDQRTRVGAAVAGWRLEGRPHGLSEAIGVPPGDLRFGPLAARTVVSVLLRDWQGGPTAPDPFDLLVAAADRLPGPWSVCRPRTSEQKAIEEAQDSEPSPTVDDPTVLYAVDHVRGTRIALVAVPPPGKDVVVPGMGPFTWTVDHLEHAPAARPVEQLWGAMGYADCPELGRVIDADRVRRPKRPLGPAQSSR